MAFYLTQAQVNILQYLDPTWAENYYANIYDLIYEFVQSPDPFGTSADDNVIAWFGAAKDANRGVGGASEFIRNYTAYQLEMRNGSPIGGIDSLIQNASNAIAQAVLDDILDSAFVINGITYYELPTAKQIGEKDAAATVDELANYPGGVANWSGNPLFIGLGITDFWSDNILANDDNAYDLALSVGAMFQSLGATSGTGLLGVFGLFFSQGVIDAAWTGISSGGAAVGATYSYLWRSYGETNLGVGDLVAGGLLVGSAANETFTAASFTESSGWLHAGAGADIIYAASNVSEQADGSGVFDGGEGNDLMSFWYSTTPDDGGVTAQITEWASGVPYSALVNMPYGGQAFLFNMEGLSLSDADDRLVIESLTTTLQQVDALDSQDQGDTLDASGLGSAFSFDMATGAFASGSATLQLSHFENVVGSTGSDTITGSDVSNILHGGTGADFLSGFGADDFIFFDAADGANVYGGAGRDVAVALGVEGVTVDMWQQALECVIGCDGADTITVGSLDDILFAAGGGGDDTFNISYDEANGEGYRTRVLWGGEGADTFVFDNGVIGSVAIVRIEGLTEEAFAHLTLADLGFDGIDANSCRTIIINPDSNDQIDFVNPEMTPGYLEGIDDSENDGWDFTTKSSDFLGRPLATQSIFLETMQDLSAELYDERDEFENVLSISYWTGNFDADGWALYATDEYDPMNQADQDRAEAFIRSYYEDGVPTYDWNPQDNSPFGPWFVVGGHFTDSGLVANGDFTGSLPDIPETSPFDWLLAA